MVKRDNHISISPLSNDNDENTSQKGGEDMEGVELNLDDLSLELEETIDNVLEPQKPIEIDPVSSEVKLVHKGEESEADNDNIEPQLELNDVELEFEDDDKGLRVEFDLNDDNPVEHGQQEEDISRADSSLAYQLNNLYEAVLTIGIDSKEADFSSIFSLLDTLSKELGQLGSDDVSILLSSVRRLLQALKDNLTSLTNEFIKGAVDAILKAINTIIEITKETNPVQPSFETIDMIRDTKKALGVHLSELQKAHIETSSQEAIDQREDGGEDINLGVELDIANEERDMQPDMMELSSSGSIMEIDYDRLKLGIGEAISDIVLCIEKMSVLRRSLEARGKAEILRLFLGSLEEAIRRAALRLSEYTGSTVEIRELPILPDIDTSLSPPLEEAITVNWGGQLIALFPEDICLSIPLSKLKRRINPSDNTLKLKSLKKWPWSKVRDIVTGELSLMDEDALNALELPIVKNPLSSISYIPNEKDLNLIVIYRDQKGCALIVDESMSHLNCLDGWKWTEESPSDSDNALWIGYLEKDDEKIPLFSPKSCSDT